MIKKSELRSEFERIVKTLKSVSVDGFSSPVPIRDFRLEVNEFGAPCIFLRACFENAFDGFGYVESVVVARSYPFRSYKSAYQTLVRL